MKDAFAAFIKRIRNAKHFSGNYVFPLPKSSEDQKRKKGIHRKLSPKLSDNQKKVFTAIWD